MHDLLTNEEVKVAAAQGWCVHDVYSSALQRWHVQVLPTQFAHPLPHADAAAAYVIGMARGGDKLAAKALGLVMASHLPKGKK